MKRSPSDFVIQASDQLYQLAPGAVTRNDDGAGIASLERRLPLIEAQLVHLHLRPMAQLTTLLEQRLNLGELDGAVDRWRKFYHLRRCRHPHKPSGAQNGEMSDRPA
jgi:hypothetical protein